MQIEWTPDAWLRNKLINLLYWVINTHMVPVFITSHSVLSTLNSSFQTTVIVLKLLPQESLFYLILTSSSPHHYRVVKLHFNAYSHSVNFFFAQWRSAPVLLFLCLCARSEFALIYNDRSVQESHHLSAAFRLLQDDQMNIFTNLSREEWM